MFNKLAIAKIGHWVWGIRHGEELPMLNAAAILLYPQGNGVSRRLPMITQFVVSYTNLM
ncbi:hypothetical protein [Nostoc sp.]|uniref:hypothetical protein n=1 Tax=Nostoc sp. TaxID=1180 RepID=UPI002FF84534